MLLGTAKKQLEFGVSLNHGAVMGSMKKKASSLFLTVNSSIFYRHDYETEENESEKQNNEQRKVLYSLNQTIK